jgi:predicted phosphodiesterase
MKNYIIILSLILSFGILNAQNSKNYKNNKQHNVLNYKDIKTSLYRKAPYLLYPGNNTEMLIEWQMTETKTCEIVWGQDTTYADGQAFTTEHRDHQHEKLISNLSPATHYFYQVNYENIEPKKGDFYTGALDTETKFSFYAYGDTRSHPDKHDEVAAEIMTNISQHPESQSIIISTGDIVSNGDQEQDWDSQFFSPAYPNIQQMLSHLPYITAVGNHEGQGVLFDKYFPYPMFSTNRFYYGFDYANVHFTVIDQFTDYTPGSIQYNWIVNDLASTDKTWKMIILHMPGWSAGGGHGNNSDVQDYIQPLCLQYGVSFVLTGHNHYYSRANVDGVMHITTGGGGAPLYDPNINAPYIVMVDKSTHYCKIDINQKSLEFTARRSNGSIIESFNYDLDLSKTHEIEQSEFAKHFHIYYQHGKVYINNIDHLDAQFSIYDNWGKSLKENNKLDSQKSISVRVPGIYYIKINTAKNQFVKKLIVP